MTAWRETLSKGQRVRVHYHRDREDWSVISPRTGRVIASVADITLTAVVFRVQPAGLARIRRSGQRHVCAYAVGTVESVCSAPDVTGWLRVTFNPFRDDSFVVEQQTEAGLARDPVTEAGLVAFSSAAGWAPAAGWRGT